MIANNPHKERLRPTLLDLPEEALMLIALHSGVASAVRLSSTCTRLRTLIDSEALWRSFMDKTGNDISITPGHAKEAVLQHYCKSCDMIVSGVAMFYTGGTPMVVPRSDTR